MVYNNSTQDSSIVVTEQRNRTLALPIIVNMLGNHFLAQFTTGNDKFKIKAFLAPAPIGEYIEMSNNYTSSLYTCGVFVITMTLVNIFFLIPVAQESASGVKHLQFMTGVSPATYWATTFVLDFAMSLVSSIVIAATIHLSWDYTFSGVGNVTKNWPTCPVAFNLFSTFSHQLSVRRALRHQHSPNGVHPQPLEEVGQLLRPDADLHHCLVL